MERHKALEPGWPFFLFVSTYFSYSILFPMFVRCVFYCRNDFRPRPWAGIGSWKRTHVLLLKAKSLWKFDLKQATCYRVRIYLRVHNKICVDPLNYIVIKQTRVAYTAFIFIKTWSLKTKTQTWSLFHSGWTTAGVEPLGGMRGFIGSPWVFIKECR